MLYYDKYIAYTDLPNTKYLNVFCNTSKQFLWKRLLTINSGGFRQKQKKQENTINYKPNNIIRKDRIK